MWRTGSRAPVATRVRPASGGAWETHGEKERQPDFGDLSGFRTDSGLGGRAHVPDTFFSRKIGPWGAQQRWNVVEEVGGFGRY